MGKPAPVRVRERAPAPFSVTQVTSAPLCSRAADITELAEGLQSAPRDHSRAARPTHLACCVRAHAAYPPPRVSLFWA